MRITTSRVGVRRHRDDARARPINKNNTHHTRYTNQPAHPWTTHHQPILCATSAYPAREHPRTSQRALVSRHETPRHIRVPTRAHNSSAPVARARAPRVNTPDSRISKVACSFARAVAAARRRYRRPMGARRRREMPQECRHFWVRIRVARRGGARRRARATGVDLGWENDAREGRGAKGGAGAARASGARNGARGKYPNFVIATAKPKTLRDEFTKHSAPQGVYCFHSR